MAARLNRPWPFNTIQEICWQRQPGVSFALEKVLAAAAFHLGGAQGCPRHELRVVRRPPLHAVQPQRNRGGRLSRAVLSAFRWIPYPSPFTGRREQDGAATRNALLRRMRRVLKPSLPFGALPFRHTLPGAAALLAYLACGASAWAQSATRNEIIDLRNRLSALEQQQEAVRAAASQRPAPSNDLAGSFPRSIHIPGTDTSVRLYGFVRLTGSYDFEGRNRSDVQSANTVPLTEGVLARQGGDFQFGARRSRLGVETRTNTGYGMARSVLEMDFAGAQSTSSTSSQANWIPRLRHAYVEFANFTLGQTTTLFGDTVNGEFLDAFTFLGLGGPRQAQIRYTAALSGGASFAVGLENPLSDYTSLDGVRLPDSDGSAPPVAINRLPDLTARFMVAGGWGNVALQALVRRIDYTNKGALDPAQRFSDEAWGYGVAFGGSVNTVGKSRTFGRVAYGEGIGRYLEIVGSGATSNIGLPGISANNASLDLVKVSSATLGYQHFWTETVRSTVAGGLARLSYPSYARDFAPSTQNLQNRTLGQAIANIVWSPVPDLDVGLEYNYAERGLLARSAEGAQRGVGQRLLATATYRF
ncbi:MAG TPA: DcaP family trimeric outer membrane transporter [Roseomonas sp.]|nr:DcaP family trimeric outer membrane transporter [Roseomonas sp.]